MIKIILIIVNIILILFLYFLNEWYKKEDSKIITINKKYVANTRKLKEIGKIDKWLVQRVKHNLVQIPLDSEVADLRLIHFFDKYAKTYSFSVEKFIYNDEHARFLNIQYSFSRKNYTKLVNFMKLQYKSGYKIINHFQLDKSTLEGELIVIQPFILPKKRKEEHIDDVVPQ